MHGSVLYKVCVLLAYLNYQLQVTNYHWSQGFLFHCIVILNKNTWGVKKSEAKKNLRLKALISNEAKKSVNESAT